MAKKPEDVTVIYKPEEDKLVVTGILTAYRQGTNRFDKENERYFVSVRAKCPVAIRSAIRDKYFSDCKDKYIPDVLKKLDEANDEAQQRLLGLIDVLVDGPFVAAKRSLALSFCGSANQRLIDMKKTRARGQVVLWSNRYEPFRNREWARRDECGDCRMFRYCQGGGMHLRDEEGKLLMCHYKRL
jgi:radical SAM protein with 4Fe4S-binding SPASM domain